MSSQDWQSDSQETVDGTNLKHNLQSDSLEVVDSINLQRNWQGDSQEVSDGLNAQHHARSLSSQAIVSIELIRPGLLDLSRKCLLQPPAKLGDLNNVEVGLLRDNRLAGMQIPAIWHASLLVLDLSGNQLTSVPDVAPCSKLHTLLLNRNRLTSISGGCSEDVCPPLKEIGLAENKLSNLRGLHRFPSIARLNLADNHLTKLTSLRSLSAWPNLHILAIKGNLLCNLPGISVFLVNLLPQLKACDLPIRVRGTQLQTRPEDVFFKAEDVVLAGGLQQEHSTSPCELDPEHVNDMPRGGLAASTEKTPPRRPYQFRPQAHRSSAETPAATTPASRAPTEIIGTPVLRSHSAPRLGVTCSAHRPARVATREGFRRATKEMGYGSLRARQRMSAAQ